MSDTNESLSADDTFKILVATDNHLGYGEKDPIRENDSFVTFEEILQLAVKNEVDFLLLGGDLFHESKPSPYCIHKCTELLKKYCFGEKPVSIEFLSDQSVDFKHLANPIVNYEDPNLNIGLPVFSIHGNHDDPTGSKQISALDIMANVGLVNYFGRWTDMTKVNISPILMKKGETKLALYGLSHVRDERLGRLFRNKQVTMQKPAGDDWFNLLVLHQNRAKRGPKNFIPESFLPQFLHLVIWGHEHDCRLEPEDANGVFISQPGSSVATSLSYGESIPKKVGLLEINKTRFKMVPIPLRTVRPFMFKDLLLETPDSDKYSTENPSQQAVKQVEKAIEALIEQAALRNADRKKRPPLPLIRLVVNFHDERQTFNRIRLGQQFMNRIANPEDAVLLKQYKGTETRKRTFTNLPDDVEHSGLNIEELTMQYLENEERKDKMDILSVKGMTEALSRYISLNDAEAINNAISYQSDHVLRKLITMDPDIEDLANTITTLREQRRFNDPNAQELVNYLDRDLPGKNADESTASPAASARGRKPRAARGARGTSGKATRARGAKKTTG